MNMEMQMQQEAKKRRQSFSAFDSQGDEIKGEVIAAHPSALLLVRDAGGDVIWIVDNLEDVGVSLDVEQAEWLWRRISEWLAGLGRVASTAADERRSASLQSARDVCMYCGGRALAFFSSVDGPNEAGNFTHKHRTDKEARALCKASAIYSRLAALSAAQEQRNAN